MHQFTYYTVDVFTKERFGGNQLAVFPNASGIPEELLQKIAREFNFSETTFVYPPQNKSNDFKMRIFTPGIEVPTAGHPTIGTTYLLLSKNLIKPKNENFMIIEENIGDIRVEFEFFKSGVQSVTMYQPLPKFGKIETDINLISNLLSLTQNELNLELPIQSVSCGNNFLFVPLRKLEDMHKINIKTDLLKSVRNEIGSTEIFVFTDETIYDESDYHCRMFAPLFGIYEDPATGSAAGPFGCYLVQNKTSKKNEFLCEQGFEMMRPSFLKIKIEVEKDIINKVKVSGDSVIVCEGKISI